jgi:phage gpG-like protein
MSFEFHYDREALRAMGRRVMAYAEAGENVSPLLQSLATALADEWRKNIDAGPTERWEAGASIRAAAQSGTTLKDKAILYRSISGGQSGADEITIGSALAVGEFNLLSIHEFGATVRPRDPMGFLQFRLPFAAGKPWLRKKEVRIPARPTSPFDWDKGDLTPEAAALVERHGLDYVVNLGGNPA